MSRDGQSPQDAQERAGPVGGPGQAIVVSSSTLPRGRWFAVHRHPVHQLAWSRAGLLTVRTAAGAWLMPPSLALWIPAGTPHATGTGGGAFFRSPYVAPERCPITWAEPTVVAVTPLLRELIEHLAAQGQGQRPDERGRAEAVLFDLLHPVSVRTISVTRPADPRARLVAEALTADPADDRPLSGWAALAATSARTLARLFSAETGTSFGRWRERCRMQAAMPLLADGLTVEAVAHRVGYASASSFVAAFHRVVGLTPRQYFP